MRFKLTLSYDDEDNSGIMRTSFTTSNLPFSMLLIIEVL